MRRETVVPALRVALSDLQVKVMVICRVRSYFFGRAVSASGRWVFPSKHGLPDGHLLRKLKKVAYRAGLNCGHCVNRAGVFCKDADVCAQFKLHKFRKTCATRWASSDIPLNDIREYLGHESLATTQKYLGTTPPHKARPNIDRAFGD
jgi:integrase